MYAFSGIGNLTDLDRFFKRPAANKSNEKNNNMFLFAGRNLRVSLQSAELLALGRTSCETCLVLHVGQSTEPQHRQLAPDAARAETGSTSGPQ